MDDEAKRGIDRLQGLVQAETGERLSHSDLLARLPRFARRHEAQFLNESRKGWGPSTSDEVDALFAQVEDWGVETDASRIDEELYGRGGGA